MKKNSRRIRPVIPDPSAPIASSDFGFSRNGNGAPLHPNGSTICLDGVTQVADELESAWPSRPELDVPFIRQSAVCPVPSGRAVVENHHLVRHLRVFGPKLSKLLGFLQAMEANFASLDSRATGLEKIKNATAPKIEVTGDGAPWTAWARCKVAFILFLSFLCILVDMNSVATTLKESGIGTFQSWIRAWFYSMVPLGFALCLKLLRDWMNPDKPDRTIHAIVVTSLGILFGGLWLWFFACTFPNIARSAADLLNSLSLSGAAPEASGYSSTWLIASGLAAAAFVAAAGWTAVEKIVEQHRVPRRVDNPAFLTTQEELDKLRPILERQWVLITRARNLITRIEKEQGDYLAEANNLYTAAQAAVTYGREAYQRIFGDVGGSLPN